MNIFDLLHEPIQLTPPIRMFSAFSGIGTQEMALKRITNNYEIVGYSEIDKYAIKSYHAIHGDVKDYGDITKMTEIPPCDIFTWSFPCTDLSKAGKQKGMGKDTRSGLAYEVLRLVEFTKDKPKVLIMENVPDLIQEKFVRQFGEIAKCSKCHTYYKQEKRLFLYNVSFCDRCEKAVNELERTIEIMERNEASR